MLLSGSDDNGPSAFPPDSWTGPDAGPPGVDAGVGGPAAAHGATPRPTYTLPQRNEAPLAASFRQLGFYCPPFIRRDWEKGT